MRGPGAAVQAGAFLLTCVPNKSLIAVFNTCASQVQLLVQVALPFPTR